MLSVKAVAVGLLLTAGAPDLSGYAAVSFAEFERMTKEEHREEFAALKGDGPRNVAFVHPIESLRVRVAWTGRLRPLAGYKGKTVADYFRFRNPQVVDLLRNEMEVVEGGKARWLPVKETLVPFLRDEVLPGGSAELFVLYLGNANSDWVYVVNDFAALRPPAKSK